MLAVLMCAAPTPAAEQGTEFFERKIRPLLAEKCYTCHAKTATSGLRLDSKAGTLRGGTRGAAIVPGDAERSLLLRAVSYQDAALAMPPTGKLSAEQIADLTAWVRMGAPDPREQPAERPAETPPAAKSLDLTEARRFWAFQPVRAQRPPAVRRKNWMRTPIDAFLLAALERRGLQPAPAADRRTLLRRVTFDLTGLPPTAQEVDAFLADRSPRAWEKVVDRLLASPHYGERWARHWLDLVRFGETSGHEFDSEKPDAWRYRDYAIRAFNQDLPYDRFIEEHLAGDLLDERRRSPGGGEWDSALGTGFFGLHEERNAADDLAEVQAENVDNQIDVLAKTFLGLTVACARCHDHKFDPIPTTDYYALAGVMHSTRQHEEAIDTPARRQEMESVAGRLARANARIAALLGPARRAAVESLKTNLLEPPKTWKSFLERAAKEPDHVFHPFAVLSQPSAKPFPERVAELRGQLEEALRRPARTGDIVLADFAAGSYDGWQAHGPAFGAAPSTLVPPNQWLAGYQGGALANSFGAGSDELTGVLISKSFLVERKYLHVRMAGTVDRTRRREHGVLRLTLQIAGRPAFVNVDEAGVFQWKTTGITRNLGLRSFLLIADRSRTGHIAVDKILLSDDNKPPALPPNPLVAAMLGEAGLDSPERLAEAYQRLFARALAGEYPEAGARWLLAAIDPEGKLENLASRLAPDDAARLVEMGKERAAAEANLPQTTYGLVSSEDEPRDSRVALRGNLANPGAEVPRGFLQVLSADGAGRFRDGSGRRELARAIAVGENPLTARVMVNRIWKHHFGEGLVRTVDNFGRTGERPSHPELLDYLAGRFVASGWSIRAMHRLILASSAYRMTSRPGARAARLDPENRLLHHMPVRRLEAESIRDSILAVAGTLDRTLYGPGILPHISPYQDGRGKPESGPLDGRGRRSIYIQVRRNFLTPLLLAFDFPPPATTVGRRGITSVPAQALALMNNEFVADQAQQWATRVCSRQSEPRERIRQMFLEAYGRPPAPAEIAQAREFLREQEALAAASSSETGPWASLAHVLINSKEFIFVR